MALTGRMSPTKVERSRVRQLTDLPNIGRAGAEDLRLLGITEPRQLINRDPFEMHRRLCEITGVHHDPCVIDVFISVTRFMNGEAPQVWWAYTEARKKSLRNIVVRKGRVGT